MIWGPKNAEQNLDPESVIIITGGVTSLNTLLIDSKETYGSDFIKQLKHRKAGFVHL